MEGPRYVKKMGMAYHLSKHLVFYESWMYYFYKYVKIWITYLNHTFSFPLYDPALF